MGFRASFIKHEGLLACHSEIVLQALERAGSDQPAAMLHMGVGNGGTMQIWQDVLPEGSIVLGVDTRPECEDLPVPVRHGRIHERDWLLETFGSRTFDIVMDSTGEASGDIWPWIKPGGIYIIENYQPAAIADLVIAMCDDVDSWLPYEEIMCVSQFPKIVFIEKRNPRVVPYLDIIVGQEAPIVPESEYLSRGAKRVTVPKEVLEKL